MRKLSSIAEVAEALEASGKSSAPKAVIKRVGRAGNDTPRPKERYVMSPIKEEPKKRAPKSKSRSKSPARGSAARKQRKD